VTSTGEQPVRDLPPVHVLGIDQVRESATNPRKIPDRAVELVTHSLRRFGWKQPLVADRDGNLIVGHTRHRAARALGLTRVPVILAEDLTPAEVDAYRIADNRSHDFTTWDLPELAVQLAELEEDFADVLALADWEAVTAALEDATRGLPDLNLPTEVQNALDGGFVLTVCFHTKEQALAAEQTLIDLPGAFDVRHGR
jgi:ParB-like chromosome segregation protein Spo0J